MSATPVPAEDPFLTGGDVSMLPRLEELGAVYRDGGRPEDALRIMMRHGATCFRVRLFVDPSMRGDVVQDLGYVVGLAGRIKQSGAALLLDLHYSDTWADPGRQQKPEAWRGLDFEALEARVEAYTGEVVGTLKAAGCLPDVIQLGNEIAPGFLWPEGRLGPGAAGWDRFAALLRAAVRGARAPLGPDERVRILIHVHSGGDAAATVRFYENLERREVAFDMIGLSYYPWWHGGLSDLRRTLRAAAERFGKEIVVVETAYAHASNPAEANPVWAQTPEGQRRFLGDVIAAVRATPHELGAGVLWWYPEAVPVRGFPVWKGGSTALFDAGGRALPALNAFRVSAAARR